ncbi:DoxX family protein [Marinococcus luteus]|uniref:DoxX family protein n=1 Tax=Marinococcus luteus TaxID=1122204 RepID=UPI002ACC85E1|nr:DoxX family protein [Marinococcus luteus]MDZ5782721.1 DoxX family protein [Marinococcus luteus]
MKNIEAGLLILRVVTGVIFLAHGTDKLLNGMDASTASLGSMGMPDGTAFAVAVIEAAGGILLILGLLTRVVAGLFALIMLGAIVTVKWQQGLIGGFELDLILMAASIHLALTGSRMLALKKRKKKRSF